MLKQSGIGITQKPSSSSSSTDSLVSPTNQQHHDNVHTNNSFHIHTQLNEPCKMMYHQLDIFIGVDSNCGYQNQIWVQNPHNSGVAPIGPGRALARPLIRQVGPGPVVFTTAA